MSALAIADTSWFVAAACARQPSAPEFFSDDPRDIERAKATCAGCPVRAQCLAHARKNREQFGIWGGLTAEERGMKTTPHERCLGCGGVLVPVSETRDKCLACGSTWYA